MHKSQPTPEFLKFFHAFYTTSHTILCTQRMSLLPREYFFFKLFVDKAVSSIFINLRCTMLCLSVSGDACKLGYNCQGLYSDCFFPIRSSMFIASEESVRSVYIYGNI